MASAISVVVLLALSTPVLSYSPVIGILAEPVVGNDKPSLKPLGRSLLAASYVKWIEAAGARVVPLPYTLSPDEVRERYAQINGLLFPGGGVSINTNSSYAFFSRKLFDWAVADRVPVWGTCLGFEQLMVYSSQAPVGAGGAKVLSHFDSEALFLPLNLKEVKRSWLLGNAPDRVIQTLSTQNVTANLHTSGVAPRALRADSKLNATWRVLATNLDRKGNEFVSLAEGTDFPLYASQFHPEKNAFEFHQAWDIESVGMSLHSPEAIEASAWLARKFVERARLSTRRFKTEAAFSKVSIYNYAPVYTDKLFPGKDLWEQTYVFP